MRGYIFDMDGTLFQTNLILTPALEETFQMLRDKGLWEGETPLERYEAIMGVPLPEVWRTLCPLHTELQHQVSNDFFQHALIRCIQNRQGALYDGVEDVLSKLSKVDPLFIASNGQTAYLQAIVDTYQLQRYFQAIYSIDVESSGNKADLVARIIREQQLEEGAVIGDRLSDFEAAHKNHFKAIGVAFDFAQQQELHMADEVVTNFKALPLLLK
ncbi:MAG: HAD hydrolase-like protein [Kurthia gibsonii]|uniref:HAD hydrolase-like protein n=1 Tax=Kurthia gibsonii TaxID=33946 RepID=UPI000B3F2F7B